jgi:hypothetical protein
MANVTHITIETKKFEYDHENIRNCFYIHYDARVTLKTYSLFF